MGLNCISASAVSTGLSFAALLWRSGLELAKIESDGTIGDGGIHSGNAATVMELLLGSNVMMALLANFVFNLFVLVILCFKTIFFAELYPSETRKVIENLVNYVIYKGTFLPLVIPQTLFQAVLWSSWLIVMCCLKMFQTLARDRLERLNSSPSATPWTYLRVYSVFLVVLAVDISWVWLCLVVYRSLASINFLLLFFEPLSIGFETFQAIIVHGFQLLDMWLRHVMERNENCRGSFTFDRSTAGSLCDFKSTLVRNVGFLLEVMSLLMVLGHYLQIWWLRGMAFHLVDAILLLNMRALVSAIFKRIKGFIKLKLALNMLDEALPDATKEELHSYNDDCTICREAMSRAKRLSCNHLFHLWCLRSWLDQGLNEVHACPTCRRPLFTAAARNSNNERTAELLNDEQVARQLSMLDNSNSSVGLTPAVGSNQWQNPPEADVWRGLGLDPNWVQSLPNTGLDGAGSSTAIRSVGLGRVQMMMRHLASVGETYAHTGLEDTAWGLWPMGQPPATSGSASTAQPSTAVRFNSRNTDGLRLRNARSSTNDNLPGLLVMADAVTEVLPHIPRELILQDLQRTNNVTITVNNLLQL